VWTTAALLCARHPPESAAGAAAEAKPTHVLTKANL
jgi:hypothetical protein